MTAKFCQRRGRKITTGARPHLLGYLCAGCDVPKKKMKEIPMSRDMKIKERTQIMQQRNPADTDDAARVSATKLRRALRRNRKNQPHSRRQDHDGTK